jgi:hypothetical protein
MLAAGLNQVQYRQIWRRQLFGLVQVAHPKTLRHRKYQIEKFAAPQLWYARRVRRILCLGEARTRHYLGD